MKLTLLKSVLAPVIAEFHARNESGVEVKVTLPLKGMTRSQDDWESLIKKANEVEGSREARDAKFFAQVFSEWDVVDDEGQPVALSEASVYEMLRSPIGPQVSAGLSRAMSELRFGTPVKN